MFYAAAALCVVAGLVAFERARHRFGQSIFIMTTRALDLTDRELRVWLFNTRDGSRVRQVRLESLLLASVGVVLLLAAGAMLERAI